MGRDQGRRPRSRRGFRTAIGVCAALLAVTAIGSAAVASQPATTAVGGAVSSFDPLVLEEGTDALRDANGAWQYASIFVLAAVPWLEILVVIPVGIGLGLDPAAVAVVAFLGNVLPIYGIIAFYRQLRAAWDRRRDGTTEPSNRRKRAMRIWNRYGLPGLALASPISTGVHLAAVIALAVGSPKRAVGIWMSIGIALWTVVITAGAYYGFEFVSGLR